MTRMFSLTPQEMLTSMRTQVRERALDGIAEQRQRRQRAIDLLRRTKREVAGYHADLVPAGLEPLVHALDQDVRLEAGAVEDPRGIDRRLPEMMYQPLAQRT